MFEEFLPPQRLPWMERWFAPISDGPLVLRVRWLWLRALGAIFLSAFYSLLFQIEGLIGPKGILPAERYLPAVREAMGARSLWFAPTLFWISASDRALEIVVWIGLLASLAIIFNLAPRLSIAVAALCFLSFVAAAQDFSSYQSDGMLLEAAALSLFLAPSGWRPGLAASHPPTHAALFLLRWEWFRIYFESGLVKIFSGETQWRDLTAMDKYYENGPLPTWLGWHVQQWPHSFHAFTAAATLIIELFVACLVFLPRRARLVAFCIATPLQIGIILTANYAFLNYLVLFLGILLLDDRWLMSGRMRKEQEIAVDSQRDRRPSMAQAIVLPLLFFTTIAAFFFPTFPTVRLLDPFRVANRYGLFAVMTRARYEIEFQGTADGTHWTAYPFRYKPQDPMKAPGIYAPYQPRFEWNLWFASLGSWQENPFVINTEVRLLENSPEVLRLFDSNPFAARQPVRVRAVVWKYWFTTRDERGRTGAWWNRELMGDYAPSAQHDASGAVRIE